MCGIAGFNWYDRGLIEKMTQAIKHRGPDDEGFYLDDRVSLGNRRLAILDTSKKGHQPMEFANLVITYNGEIYNFGQLKAELESKGYKFTSGTDTEVALYSYHLWGPRCVERFNGMWGLCIYDKGENILFLSRDRFGVKPLYYYFDGNRFIFASELKAIRQHNLDLSVDTSAVNFFFYQKYIGNDLTIFKNCYKLRPSENLVFDLNRRKITRTKYYNLEQKVSECLNIPVRERIAAVEDTITDAVEKRLIADVPVGSFLSGGIDSSLISAVISRKHKDFKTFSVGFKEKTYDEVKYSELASRHIQTEHHYDYVRISEDDIEFVLKNLDEPFGDASLFPTYLLSKIARRMVTVCLSGDGGDEVFGGYDTYKAYKFARYIPSAMVSLSRGLINRLPASDRKMTLPFKMKRFVRDYDKDVCRRHLDWMATFNDQQRPSLLGDLFVGAESLIQSDNGESLLSLQLSDIHNYLAEDILKKVDLASMLNSLEVRIPFLDYRLVPLVLSLPEEYKIRRLTTKWLLKKIGRKYLPREIVYRPKRGFTAPISQWIRQTDFVREFLVNSVYYQHDLLDYGYVQGMYDAHIKKREDNARSLWLVFVLNYWLNLK